jgi:hypothetical protein
VHASHFPFPFVVLALGAAIAQGQSPVVTLTWSFTEVYAGTNTPVANPNGIIEPGEAARIELNVSYIPVAGTAFQATGGPATISGFGSVMTDLLGSNMAQGTWSSIQARPGWLLGPPGWPSPDGSAVSYITAGQFAGAGTPAPDPLNPIPALWSAVWMPAVYSARTTIFASAAPVPPPTSGFISTLFYQIDGTSHYLQINAHTIHGSVQIPIVPAPGAGVVLGVAAAAVWRRRR